MPPSERLLGDWAASGGAAYNFMESDAESGIFDAIGPFVLSERLGSIEHGCNVSALKSLCVVIPFLSRLKHNPILARRNVGHTGLHSTSEVHQSIIMRTTEIYENQRCIL
jgi:hypothetical protein